MNWIQPVDLDRPSPVHLRPGLLFCTGTFPDGARLVGTHPRADE